MFSICENLKKSGNGIFIPKNVRDLHMQKTVLKATNKTQSVIAQSAERWTLDRKGRVQGLLCKKALWAPQKIRRGCNVQQIPMQIRHRGLRKLRRHHAHGGSNL